MWPFDIFAKCRAAELAASEARIRKKTQKEASRRLNQIYAAKPQASAAQRQAGLRAVPSSPAGSYDDPLSPINPLSPLNTSAFYAQSMLAPADEPRHSSSHCDTSSSHSSHSSSDYGLSHGHSSHDHSCGSSSYDSGSSSSSTD